jgi:cell division protein FtsI/penicillin-binding protein 2
MSHSWFIGFAPVERPEIAFAVIVENGGYGSSAAVPVARELLSAYSEKK